MPSKKKATSYRISDAGKVLLAAMSEDMGIPQTQVIELAIRDLAKRRKFEVPTPKKGEEGNG